jgi:hypothetical protein
MFAFDVDEEVNKIQKQGFIILIVGMVIIFAVKYLTG